MQLRSSKPKNHHNEDIAKHNRIKAATTATTNGISKKKTSPTTLLIRLIGFAVVFIGLVNLVHSLNEQGNLPTGVTFSISFSDEENNSTIKSRRQYSKRIGATAEQRENAKAKAAAKQLKLRKGDEKVGTHFLPPPRNLHTKYYANAAASHEKENESSFSQLKQKIHGGVPTGKTTIWGHREVKQTQQQAEALQKKKVQGKERAKGNVHKLEYFMELSQREGHDKERILQLIKNNAGLNLLSEKTYEQLPRWSQVTEMYGAQPKLVGLEQCQAFQEDGDLADKFLAVAGCFNSGTNLLAKALTANCVLKKRQAKYGVTSRGVRWQVPYGKHSPPKDEEFRNSHVAKKSEGVVAKDVLPAVMIRDPFRWLQSMCSHHYTSRWPRVFGQKNPRYHCPNLWPTDFEKTRLSELGRKPNIEGASIVSETASVREKLDANLQAGEAESASKNDGSDDNEEEQPQDLSQDANKLTSGEMNLHYFPVAVKYSNFTRHHLSLVHFYNEWYQEYLDLQDYPHLLIRMEDLLFFPDEVVPQICACAGGELTLNNANITSIRLVVESAKAKHSTKFMAEGEEHTGYLDALIKYGTTATRYKGMTQQDLQYAGRYLDRHIMDLFQYGYPPEDSTDSTIQGE